MVFSIGVQCLCLEESIMCKTTVYGFQSSEKEQITLTDLSAVIRRIFLVYTTTSKEVKLIDS